MAAESTEKTTCLALWIRLILLVAVLGVFLGRAWILDRGETRIYAFLQNEDLAKDLVEEHTDMTWDQWVSDEEVGGEIKRFVGWQVWLHAGAAGACCLLMVIPRRRSWILGGIRLVLASVVLLATCDLCGYAWLSYLDAGEIPFHYLEYATLCVTPPAFMLGAVFYSRKWHWFNALVVRIALAATFVVHGLYAIGYEIEDSEYVYETPGFWIEMSVNGLGRVAEMTGRDAPDEDDMVLFLKTFGILDLVAAALIFVPYAGRLGLLYMVLWGALTAAARTWSNYLPEVAEETLKQWIPETLVRIPHFALPLFLLVLTFRRSSRLSQEINTP